MRIFQILLLSILSYGFLQTGDIFKAVENNDKKAVFKWLKTAKDLDVVNEAGQSVLIKAVQSKNSSLVYRLLKNGVQVDQVDSFGKTALDYSVDLGNKKIARMLIESNARVAIDSNAIKCKELINSGRGWRIFAAIALCFVGMYFTAMILGSFLVMAGIAVATCSLKLSVFIPIAIIGGSIFLLVNGKVISSCVKFGKHRPYELCRVGVIQSV